MVRRLLRIAALCVLACSTSASAQQQVENVAAFARLYGVARWFYPSDAAAAIDWNRFAVEGVRRVRDARSAVELETTLEELFTPLGPGIEIGASLPSMRPAGSRDPSLVAWHYRGAGFSENPGPYSAKRTNRMSSTRSQASATPVIVSQVIAADTLRGKSIRMRGQVRVADPTAPGWAGLWLRVDRTGGAAGFFDNMQNRPVRDTTWREYVIEGPIAPDATQIVFGVLSVGSMTADVDAIEISVRDSDGTWTPLAIPDASFEASANSVGRGWSQNGPSSVTRPSTGAALGAQFARLAPPTVGQPSALPTDSLETPMAGAAIDVELSLGLKARVPISLTDAEARSESPALARLRAMVASTGTSGRDDVDFSLADVVVAWSVFRHFYPYWPDLSVDWDARLRPQLQNALAAAATREAHLDVVRMVVADLRDGHGSVRDVSAGAQWLLPVQFRIFDGRLVVTASNDAAVPVGSVVTAIGGVSASTRIARETQLASGTPQWRHTRAANALLTCRLQSPVAVSVELPDGSMRSTQLPCDKSVPRAVEARPDSVVELEPGLWYVDLTRVRAEQLRPKLDTLAKARGIVFDVRGYPRTPARWCCRTSCVHRRIRPTAGCTCRESRGRLGKSPRGRA